MKLFIPIKIKQGEWTSLVTWATLFFIFYSDILKLWLGNKKTQIILTKIMKSANKATLSVK